MEDLAYPCYNVSHMESIFTVVSSKGQIVIPAALREKLGIKAGTRIAIRSEENQLILQPITDEFIRSLVGCCKGGDSLVEAREREHRIEKR
jgi:AbrB family looped-hinge helix DNA binding protein